MKKLIFSIAALVAINCCTIKADDLNRMGLLPKESTGPITNIEVKMNIDEIDVSQGITAEVIKASEERVVISAPADIIEDIEIKNTSGNLSIHFRNGVSVSSSQVNALIFVKDFTGISADSSAGITVKDTFQLDHLSINADSSGNVTGNFMAGRVKINADSSGSFTGKISADHLTAGADSSGSIALTGSAGEAVLHADSSGSIDAKGFVAGSAKLHADSSGSISVSVKDALEADADSAGNIEVIKKGGLKTSKQSSDSGGAHYREMI